MIREVEPPRPSTRLSSSAELATIAAQRKLEPRRLTKLVRGDLDWIVMKALEKDRGRRYETANALAEDVQRYLHDEPVLAGPPRAGYRLRKFLRRNKGPVLAVALVMLALVGGIVGTTWGSECRNGATAAAEKLAARESGTGRSRASIARSRRSAKRIGSEDAEFGGVRHPIQVGMACRGLRRFGEAC